MRLSSLVRKPFPSECSASRGGTGGLNGGSGRIVAVKTGGNAGRVQVGGCGVSPADVGLNTDATVHPQQKRS